MAEQLPEGLEPLPEGLVPITSNTNLPEGLEALPQGLEPISAGNKSGLAKGARLGWETTIAANIKAASEQELPSDVPADEATDATDEEIAAFQAKAKKYKAQKQAERKAYMDKLGRDFKEAEGVGKYVGLIGGALSDPLAVGTGFIGSTGKLLNLARLAKLSAAGATYEGTAAALEQETTQGEVKDWVDVAERAGLGAVAAPLGDVVLRGVGRGIGKVYTPDGVRLRKLNDAPDELFSPKEHQVFNDKLTQLQDEVTAQIAAGKPHLDALAAAEKQVGISPETTMNLMNATGRTLTLDTQEGAIRGMNHSMDTAVTDNWFKQAMTPVSTIVKEISPPLWNLLRNFQRNTMEWHHNEFVATGHLADAFDALGNKGGKLVKQEAERLFRNEKFGELAGLFRKFNVDARRGLTEYRASMDRLYKSLNEVAGGNLPYRENYAFRIIKDKKEFFKRLGKEERNFVEQALNDATEKAKRSLSDVEQTQVIHDALFRGIRPGKKAPDAVFKRKWKEIPSHFDDLYYGYKQARDLYLRDVIKDVSKRKLMGKKYIVHGENGVRGIDWESSIAKFLQEKHKVGDTNPNYSLLKNVLMSYMYKGEGSPWKSTQILRNLTYGMALGNPVSAATQLKDIGISAARFGIRDTFKAMMPNKRLMHAVNMGVTDASTEMMESPMKTARFMEWTLKKSGFNKADLFGKDTILNASLINAKRLVETPDGISKLASKYRDAYGPKEFGNLVDELRALKKGGPMTENIKLMMFHELSDLQPISHLEMPRMWLDNPNGRMYYTLKTFQLRQLDAVLNDTVRMMFKGDSKDTYKGAKNLAKYGAYLMTAGVSVDYLKDLMMGRKPTLTTLKDKVTSNLLALIMLDKYTAEQTYKKGPGTLVKENVSTIIDVPGTPVEDAWSILANDKNLKDARTIMYVPIIGRLYYYWVGGGYERAVKKGIEHYRN